MIEKGKKIWVNWHSISVGNILIRFSFKTNSSGHIIYLISLEHICVDIKSLYGSTY